MEFEESGLFFCFSPDWVIKKYDQHKFYRGLSGVGLKGVDFLGIYQGQLVLFEVKNYRRRAAWHKDNPLDIIINDPAYLANAMSEKVLDTMTAIDAVWQYYRRKWWFRLFSPLIDRFANPNLDAAFWAEAYQLMQQKEKLIAVLWFETEEPELKLSAHLQHLIEVHLADTVQTAAVANCDYHPFSDTLWVSYPGQE
ncbi:MAG TPA: hypothetical protein PKA00_21860 [Saprospiraceae bacterium]|nr:hypothetical protein [Saprospiraceae bacterium]HMQ85573.1 hypothetical protein [Saprospiraceae bacterium]